MKLYSFKKIRTRLSFWFLIMALIPMFITVFYIYFQQANNLKKNEIEKLKAIRDLKVNRLESWLEEREGDLKTAAADFDLRTIEDIVFKTSLEQKDISHKDIVRSKLQNYLTNYPDYEELFILNPEKGDVFISTKLASEGLNKSDKEYYKIPLKTRDFYSTDVYFSYSIKRPSIAFSVPIFCEKHVGKHITGILVARIDLENSLFKLLQNRTGLGNTGETLIVNKDGIVLNPLRWQENSILRRKIEAEPAVRAAGGYTGVIEAADYRGEKVLAAYTHLPATHWGFVCKEDIKEIYFPLQNLLSEVLFLILSAAVIIVLAVIALSKTISKPIVKLKKIAKEIEGENYDIRSDYESRDELGSLSNSVNFMVKSIYNRVTVQEGVKEISESIIGCDTPDELATRLLKNLMGLTGSVMGAFYRLNEEENSYEPLLTIGLNKEMQQSFSASISEGEFGTAISAGRIFYFQELPADSKFEFVTVSGNIKPQEIITIPVLVNREVKALISLATLHKYQEKDLEMLNVIWNSVNQTYGKLLASQHIKYMSENLKKVNERLQAQTEELQSQSAELQQQSEELKNTAMELEEQNEELEKQKEEVLQAARIKSEFLSNMSHELRTPLNSILALSKILRQQSAQKLSSDENNYLEIIQRNGKILLDQINDVLDLSKIEAGKMELNPSNVSLSSLLENVKSSIMPLAEEKGIELLLDLAENLPVVITDEKKLHQIVINIVNNAVKFTEKGKVHIYSNYDDENVEINVLDTGIGISEKDLPHIFNEFEQIDGSASRKYEGTGLGLSISRKLAVLMHIRIEVESELGRGSLFKIIIPRKWLGEQKTLMNSIYFPTQNISRAEENGSGELLLVEDNEVAIIQVRRILEKNGYKVRIARNGREALESVQKKNPDGVILDLMMPEIDGFEVLEKIRSKPETFDLPVLILTAKNLSNDDLKRLAYNNIQQLVHKGDIDANGLLKKISNMMVKDDKKETFENLPGTDKKVKGKEDKKTILIIEDNPDNMITLKAIVENEYNVLEAEDGFIGLRLAVSKIPDLILLDINLPGMDGIELVTMLKRSEDTKKIPVIAVTARVALGDEQELREAGCDDYMSKPVEPDVLQDKIRQNIKQG